MKYLISKSFGRNFKITFVMLATLLILSLLPGFANDAVSASIKVQGEVDNPLELTAADLKSLPRVKVQTRDHDGAEATYEGVALWDVLAKAKPRLGEKANGGIARGCVIIHAADKYRAVFSLAEIHSSFTDNKIILADQRDGKPLGATQGPFQVIVPGDKIHGRWVRQVIALEITFPGGDDKK